NQAHGVPASPVHTTRTARAFPARRSSELSNYSLPTSASGPGHITAKSVTASIVNDPTKGFDGTAAATLTASNFSLSSLVGSDSFTVTKVSGTYNSANVAAATTVSTSLIAGDFTAGATTTASNSSLPISASGPGHITAATTTTTITNGPELATPSVVGESYVVRWSVTVN